MLSASDSVTGWCVEPGSWRRVSDLTKNMPHHDKNHCASLRWSSSTSQLASQLLPAKRGVVDPEPTNKDQTCRRSKRWLTPPLPPP